MNNTFLLFYSPKPRSQVWIVKIGLLSALSKPVSSFCWLCITRLVTFLLAFAHLASVPCSIFGALAVDLWQIYWNASSCSCEFSKKNVQLASCHGPSPPVPPHTHEHHSHNNVMLSLLSVLERHFPFLAFEAVKHGGNVSQLQHHRACDNERNTHKSETTYLWLFAVYSRKSAAPSFRPQTLKYNYIERILSKMFVGSF